MSMEHDDSSLIAEGTVLTSLNTRKTKTIRFHDWFCQCNPQLSLVNGFLLMFFFSYCSSAYERYYQRGITCNNEPRDEKDEKVNRTV